MTAPFPTSQRCYLRLVRASAWYDLVVTAGFATPWTYTLSRNTLDSLSRGLGWGALPPPEPLATLFANLMGSVVVVWALLRIVKPLPIHGLFDAMARALFATWEALAVVAHHVTGLLWVFFAAEVTFGVLQAVPWWRSRDVMRGTPVRRPTPAASNAAG